MKRIMNLLVNMISAVLLTMVMNTGCGIWFHQPQYPQELLEEERS